MKKIAGLILLLVSLNAAGQKLEDFNLLNVMDGKTVSLKNFSTSAGLVIIFTMNNCPFDEYYAGRIKTLAQGKVPVLLVNAHPDANEAADFMIKCSTQRGLSVPYLADKEQILMQNLGAHKSTEAFLLKNENGVFAVVYRGAIDDNPQVAADVKQSYLKQAMDKMLSGQPVDKPEMRAVGCNLRKK